MNPDPAIVFVGPVNVRKEKPTVFGEPCERSQSFKHTKKSFRIYWSASSFYTRFSRGKDEKNILKTPHSGKILALPPWIWTFGGWKAVVVRIHMLQKWNAKIFFRKAKFHTEMNVKVAENPKIFGYHYSFPSRNDFLIKILSQYRCR
jgi:hypothetical protein